MSSEIDKDLFPMSQNDSVSRNENWAQCTHMTERLEGGI